MPLYSKDSKGELFDLIGQANTLPAELSVEEINLSVPKVTSTLSTAITDTEIGLFPKAIGRFRKNIFVKYKRLKFETLFRSNTPVIWLYTAAGPSTSPFTIYQLLPYLNKQYGLNLTEDDVIDAALPPGDTNAPGFTGIRSSVVGVKAKDTSVGFTGTFSLRWAFTEQTLDVIAPNDDLDGMVYPGGNDFVSDHPYTLDALTYGYPFDDVASTLMTAGAFDGGSTIGAPSQAANHAAVFDYIFALTGVDFGIDLASANTPMSLYGATCQSVLLPSNSAVGANDLYFSRAVVITPSPTYPLAHVAGRLILHFNL